MGLNWQDTWLKDFAPVANWAAQQTGLPASLIMAQAYAEQGPGTSYSAQQNLYHYHNPMDVGAFGPTEHWPVFRDWQEGMQAYVHTLKTVQNYRGLMAAARNGASWQELAKLLGESGYAGSGYRVGNEGPGSALISIARELELPMEPGTLGPSVPVAGPTYPAPGSSLVDQLKAFVSGLKDLSGVRNFLNSNQNVAIGLAMALIVLGLFAAGLEDLNNG